LSRCTQGDCAGAGRFPRQQERADGVLRKAPKKPVSGSCSVTRSSDLARVGERGRPAAEALPSRRNRSTIRPSRVHRLGLEAVSGGRDGAGSRSAQGACTRAPNGRSARTRASPRVSVPKSPTTIERVGLERVVAASCSGGRGARFCAADSSSGAARGPVDRLLVGYARQFAQESPIDRPTSIGRPGPCPFQKGSRPARPGKERRSRRRARICSTRHVLAPRVMRSPSRVSKTISSSNSPTRGPPSPRWTA